MNIKQNLLSMNKRPLSSIILALFFISTISSCDRFGSSGPTPTLISTGAPFTTMVPLTATPSATFAPSDTPSLIPTETLIPTDTPIPATLPPLDPTYFVILTRNAPAPTVTPNPDLGRVAIQIDTPGDMSKLVSPIEVRGYIAPSLAGNTIIELIGEDGRTITRITKKTESILFQYARLSLSVPYEIRSGGELARLQVRTENKNGFITGLNSVHVLLLSLGVKELNPSFGSTEICLLSQPLANARISGGEVRLEGEMRPFNNSSIIFELTDGNGKALGNRVMTLAPADGSYQKFTATIPYSVGKSTQGYLVVRQSDDRIPGLRYVYTQPITLLP